MPLSRRYLLTSASASVALSTLLPAPAWADDRAHGELHKDPFTLGVASGDPTYDGVVLWTRLAPDPLTEDGSGGMPNRAFEVEWQLAGTEKFTKSIASGKTTATPEWGHSVHVEVDGLKPNGLYFYRFKVGKWVSPVAMTRTAPDPNTMPNSLHMAFTSCAQYEHGFFHAYRRLAESMPELILHLGDYTYEYAPGAYQAEGVGNVREHVGPESHKLGEYRLRHAQYKSDKDLQAAHAVAPWIVVWDDHDVDNNWAAEDYEEPDFLQPDFKERRIAAAKAFYENLPLRSTSVPDGLDIQLYRRLQWGQLATFHMLDTRQYRDDQGCGDGWQRCPDAYDPERSITGDKQEKWLLGGLAESQARWDLLGQQVFFAQRDRDAGPLKMMSTDAWDGYQGSRERITQGWIEREVRNPVVLTGDVHTHWAGELKSDYDDPTGKSVGVELVSSSVTSGGDGVDAVPEENPFLKINPHLKFYSEQRGFVATKITPEQMDVDFQVVPWVSREHSEGYIRRSYAIVDGEHTLHETYDRPVNREEAKQFGDEPSTKLEDGDDEVPPG